MKTNIKRLLSYTLRFKFSFVISIIGFITFAAADIAAVEWIRRVIQFINDSSAVNHNLIALALVLIAFMRGLGFFIGNYPSVTLTRNYREIIGKIIGKTLISF